VKDRIVQSTKIATLFVYKM